MGANFNNTAGIGTISNWAISPYVELCDGATWTFYTRKFNDGGIFPDRLEARISTNGASVNVGTGALDVGDFTQLALSVNPSLAANGYPYDWTQYTITYNGPPTSGRLALRYYVTSAGPSGQNSNYIGIDTFEFTPGTCDFIPTLGEWGLIILCISLVIVGVVAVRQRVLAI